MPSSVMTAVIAVAAVVVIFAIAGSIWFCWFRKRRRQARAKTRSASPGGKDRKAGYSRHRSPADSSSLVCEAKADMEECGTIERLDRGEFENQRSELVRGSNLPLLPPPARSAPVQEVAELPLFITPRSSWRIFSTSPRSTSPAELDAGPRSPGPGPVENEGEKGKLQRSISARRSESLSLQQIFHVRKLAELEGNANLSSRPSERLSHSGDSIGNQLSIGQRSLPFHGHQKLSLQHFFHLGRVAELEGSSESSTQPPDADMSGDQESQNPSPRRFRRLSLHRLLDSIRPAELGGAADNLHGHQRTEQDRKIHQSPPPLPPKDIDIKLTHPTSHLVRRATTPIELDASEPVRLSRHPLQKLFSDRSPILSDAAPVDPFSSSSAVCKDQEALKRGDHVTHDASEDLPIALAGSSVNLATDLARLPKADALEFLDLASTESEAAESEDLGFGVDDDDDSTSWNYFGTPHDAAPEGDLFSIVETNSILLGPSSTSAISPKSQRAQQINTENAAEEVLPANYEIDALELTIKRKSRTQVSHSVLVRSEGLRKRPDFVTFKKQMSEAERRAKMVAKRRSRRRLTLKSF